MNYKKIAFQWDKYPERLNRTLLVRSDIDLITFANIILNAFNVTLNANFAFVQQEHAYTLNLDDADALDAFYDTGCIETFQELDDITYDKLNSDFTFLYFDSDFSDTSVWAFSCQIEGIEKKPKNQYAYLLDGKGKSIWINAMETQEKYYDGELDTFTTKSDLLEMHLPIPHFIHFLHFLYELDNFHLNEEQMYFSKLMNEDVTELSHMYAEDYIDYAEYMNEDDDYDSDYEDDDYMDEDEIDEAFLQKLLDEEGIDISKEELEIGKHLFFIASHAVFLQMNELEEVEETYERLAKAHDEEYAHTAISELIFNEIASIIIGDDKKKLKSYLKKLEELE